MRNAAAPSVGGEMSAPMPAADRMAPADLGTIPGGPEQRPGDGAQHHGRGDAAARNRTEQETGDRDGAAGRRTGSRSAHRRHRPVDEEAAGAGALEDRTVDREQDDVGRGDIERHAEDALERHVERADETVELVAAMGDERQTDAIEGRPSPAVEDEANRRRRQDPANRSACGLEHEQNGDGPQRDVDGQRSRPRGTRTAEVDDGPDSATIG